MSEDRVPPSSKDAETSVLGAVLREPLALNELVAMGLAPDDFYQRRAQLIFGAMLDLYRDGTNPDAVLLQESLRAAGKLDEAGGPEELTRLWDEVPSAANIVHYAGIVKNKSMLRRLIATCRTGQEAAFEDRTPAKDVIDRVSHEVYRILLDRGEGKAVPVAPVIRAILEEIDSMAATIGRVRGVRTGFADLDDYLGSFQPGKVTLIAARPSVGKCEAAGTEVVMENGAIATIENLVAARSGRVATLRDDWKIGSGTPSEYLDNGTMPVWRVTTRLGKSIRVTAEHPFRTLRGWTPLSSLRAGDTIAVPRILPIFGSKRWRPCQLKLLAYLIGDGCLVNRSPTFTKTDKKVACDFLGAVEAFGGVKAVPTHNDKSKAPAWRIIKSGRRSAALSNVQVWLRRLKIDGKPSAEKFIPDDVFALRRSDVAIFLSRLLATDGWATVTSGCSGQIGYGSMSERLCRQIQHLLLRFGIIAKMRRRTSRIGRHGTKVFVSWTVDVTDRKSIETFGREIGIYGKEQAVRLAVESFVGKNRKTNVDLIPIDAWELIRERKGSESWSSLARRAGIAGHTNMHVGKRAISRGRMKKLAVALGDAHLVALSESDVFWDRVVSIEPDGVDRVFDLAVDGTHNFVANDIVVHNSSLAVNMAVHAALVERAPTLFFSLEVDRQQVAKNMLASVAEVATMDLDSGVVLGNDAGMTRIEEAAMKLSAMPLFLDDSAGLDVLQLRAKTRHMVQHHGIKIVFLDYLQLMRGEGRSENRVMELEGISREIKNLARDLEIPIVALAQVNRAAESREKPKPRLSDLRGSGALENDADAVLLIYRPDYYDDKSDVDPYADVDATIIIAKNRTGRTGEVTLRFKPRWLRFESKAQDWREREDARAGSDSE